MDYRSAQKPPNIFQSFIYAFLPHKYGRLVKVKTGGMIGFVVLLVLLATLVNFTVVGVSYLLPLWKDFPDIVIDNGKMHIDKEFTYADSGTYISVTNDADEYTYEDVAALAQLGYYRVLIANQDKLLVKQQGKYQEYYFKDLIDRGERIVVKDLLKEEFIPFMWVIAAILLVIFAVFGALWYFLCATLYFLLGMLLALIQGKKLPAGHLFRIAVYSKVVMYVVALLLNVISRMNFSLSMLLRIIVTLGFIGLTIYFIPSEDGTGTSMAGTDG